MTASCIVPEIESVLFQEATTMEVTGVTVATVTTVMGAMVAIMIILMDLATMVSIRLMTVLHALT